MLLKILYYSSGEVLFPESTAFEERKKRSSIYVRQEEEKRLGCACFCYFILSFIVIL